MPHESRKIFKCRDLILKIPDNMEDTKISVCSPGGRVSPVISHRHQYQGRNDLVMFTETLNLKTSRSRKEMYQFNSQVHQTVIDTKFCLGLSIKAFSNSV